MLLHAYTHIHTYTNTGSAYIVPTYIHSHTHTHLYKHRVCLYAYIRTSVQTQGEPTYIHSHTHLYKHIQCLHAYIHTSIQTQRVPAYIHTHTLSLSHTSIQTQGVPTIKLYIPQYGKDGKRLKPKVLSYEGERKAKAIVSFLTDHMPDYTVRLRTEDGSYQKFMDDKSLPKVVLVTDRVRILVYVCMYACVYVCVCEYACVCLTIL